VKGLPRRIYTLTEKIKHILEKIGYSTTCGYCGEQIKVGEQACSIRPDRNNGKKECFHVDCYEQRKAERREEYKPSFKVSKPRTPRPPKIKSDVTVNLYYCNRCRRKVHAKVSRDDYGKITEFACVECGEPLIRPMSGAMYLTRMQVPQLEGGAN
jgi:hypothetical protein